MHLMDPMNTSLDQKTVFFEPRPDTIFPLSNTPLYNCLLVFHLHFFCVWLQFFSGLYAKMDLLYSHVDMHMHSLLGSALQLAYMSYSTCRTKLLSEFYWAKRVLQKKPSVLDWLFPSFQSFLLSGISVYTDFCLQQLYLANSIAQHLTSFDFAILNA